MSSLRDRIALAVSKVNPFAGLRESLETMHETFAGKPEIIPGRYHYAVADAALAVIGETEGEDPLLTPFTILAMGIVSLIAAIAGSLPTPAPIPTAAPPAPHPPIQVIYHRASYTFTGSAPHTVPDVGIVERLCDGSDCDHPNMDRKVHQPIIKCKDKRSVLIEAQLGAGQVVKFPSGLYVYHGGVTCWPYILDAKGHERPANIQGYGITLEYYRE